MNSIDFCELKIGAKELTPISDDVIKSCLSGYTGKDAILRVLLFSTYAYDRDNELNEVIEYYYNMIDRVGTILGVEYTSNEKTALVLTKLDDLLTRMDGSMLESLNEIIRLFEQVDDIGFDTEGMKYVSYLMRYRLLYLYSVFYDESHYVSMKNLLGRVKSEYEEYSRLRTFVYDTYATNY